MEFKKNEKSLLKSVFMMAMVVVLMTFFMSPLPSVAEEYDFWVQTPTDWRDKTDSLGNDLKKQVMAPAGDAFIEVYAKKGSDIGAEAIADGMEQGLRSRDTAYVQNRVSSQSTQVDGIPAILREYTGNYNGILLRCYALYAYGNGGRFAIFGVFVDNQSAKYKDMVFQSVKSLRFSQPGQASGQTGNDSPYGVTPPQSQSLGCNSIVGKWKWFTGSTVDFGFNGTIPGNGNHWECLDNGRTFKIVWNNGQWIDTLTLSPDGMRLEGKNQFGSRVWGQRIGQAPAASGSGGQTPAVGTGSISGPAPGQGLDCHKIVGKWKWFTGSTVDFGFNGEMTGNGNHWECLDNGRTFKIVWNNGQWIDTLTLSPDGMRLEGKNQFGSRVWGQRIGQAPAAGGSAGQAAVIVPIPAANKAYKVSGNMGAQWGLAHGSLKVNDPSKWVLATIAGVQLNFIDPYLQGKQSYIVRVFSKASGTKLSETIIGRSGIVTLSPGEYIIEVLTTIHYAGWRCEWK